jgi:hypothetical protein
MRFSNSGFCHELVSPKPLSIPLGPFIIFSKICREFAAQGAPPVMLTLGANVKIFNKKSFKYFVFTRTPLDTRVNIWINFF